jgi:hypothetical protein
VSLVTTSIKESSPARGEGDHGVALAGMRAGEDEDDPLLSIFRRRGISGTGWAVVWAGPNGLLVGFHDQVSPGKPLFYFLFSFLFTILC